MKQSNMEQKEYIRTLLTEAAIPDYNTWKKKNVTLRGIKDVGVENGVFGSFGKGLYTAPLSNKALAKQYGTVHFIVNGAPKNPKVVNTWNDAELLRQNLVNSFCVSNGVEYDIRFFEKHTTMEAEMQKLGFDGLVIKGREMVNYTPENVLYFKDEHQLRLHYEFLHHSQSDI